MCCGRDGGYGFADYLCISLYKKIDSEKVQCLNESEEGAGKTVFKPWDERFDRTKASYVWQCVLDYTEVRYHFAYM